MTHIDLKTRAHLITLYGEKHRYYHTLDHIYDCLAKLEEYSDAVGMSADLYTKIETVLWFHDAIYIPRSKKNEENSAELFMSVFGANHGISHNSIDLICSAILATKHHKPINNLEQIVCDIDLSILGAELKHYAQYHYDIWQEYKFVPHDKFVAGRTVFLNGMLQKPEIFRLDYFKNLYEKQARENIEWELSTLSRY